MRLSPGLISRLIIMEHGLRYFKFLKKLRNVGISNRIEHRFSLIRLLDASLDTFPKTSPDLK